MFRELLEDKSSKIRKSNTSFELYTCTRYPILSLIPEDLKVRLLVGLLKCVGTGTSRGSGKKRKLDDSSEGGVEDLEDDPIAEVFNSDTKKNYYRAITSMLSNSSDSFSYSVFVEFHYEIYVVFCIPI